MDEAILELSCSVDKKIMKQFNYEILTKKIIPLFIIGLIISAIGFITYALYLINNSDDSFIFFGSLFTIFIGLLIVFFFIVIQKNSKKLIEKQSEIEYSFKFYDSKIEASSVSKIQSGSASLTYDLISEVIFLNCGITALKLNNNTYYIITKGDYTNILRNFLKSKNLKISKIK